VRVGGEVRTTADLHSPEVEVSLSLLGHHGDAGVALQIPDLLGLGVGPEGDGPVDEHEVHRHEGRAAVSVDGGDVYLALTGQKVGHLLVGHADPLPLRRHVLTVNGAWLEDLGPWATQPGSWRPGAARPCRPRFPGR